MSGLVIIYEVTDDTPDCLPWPPVGEDYYWHAVKHERGRTTWRRVALQVATAIVNEPPP
jgi:hypothetical protein